MKSRITAYMLICFLILLSINIWMPRSEIPEEKPPNFTTIHASQVALVTYFKPQTNKKHSVHFDEKVYNKFNIFTLTNMLEYTTKQGMPFFYRNSHLVDTEKRSAYWGKMALVKNYLREGFEWVIWTDTDVLFMNQNRSLVEEWIKPAHLGDKHLAFVGECSEDINDLSIGSVRSGFFGVKNSQDGFLFLSTWENMYHSFKDNWNPEQEALEAMMKYQKWINLSHFVSSKGIHSYPYCFNDVDPDISLHFPGPLKDDIPKWAKISSVDFTKDFLIAEYNQIDKNII